jgi:hypothetical protein
MASFWPPPRATSVWVDDAKAATGGRSYGDIAHHMEAVLRDAGYPEHRFYPIGADCRHGFATTTRLERTGDDGRPLPPAQRWMTLFPEPTNLRWLADARHPRLPGQGRYRSFLIAFTDLPFGAEGRGPIRSDETTLMEGTDGTATTFPREHRPSPRYRFGAFIYEYEARESDGLGFFVANDPSLPPSGYLPPLQDLPFRGP